MEGGAREIGEVVDSMGADDAHSFKIKLGDFTINDGGLDEDVIHYFTASAFVAVPVYEGTDPASISCVSARVANDGKIHQTELNLFGFLATTKDGDTKLVNFAHDASGYYHSSVGRIGPFGWSSPTLNIKHFLDADDDLTGVYLDDQNRMIIQVGLFILFDEYDFDGVYFDDIAVGGADAQAGAYEDFNGTSMAAPAVVGALAVVSKDEKPSKDIDKAELGLQALKRSARLRAATAPSDDLDAYCATGGYVNLSHLGDYSSTEDAPLAPIITSATARLDQDKRVLDVEGYFFGADKASSAVFVDGQEAQIDQWSDGKIAVQVDDSVKNGAHVVCVQTTAGKDRYAFSSSYDQEGLRLYEEELSIPDMATFFSDEGTGKMNGGLVGSGDYIYALQEDAAKSGLCLWRYSIKDNEWTVCADGKLPLYNGMPLFQLHAGDSVLAATNNGVVLYAQFYDGSTGYWGDIITALYDYDATTDKWNKREITAEIPTGAGVFSKGEDLYFVGGGLRTFADGALALSVLKPGANKVKVLGYIPYKEFEDGSFDGLVSSCLQSPKIAVTNSYVYVTGHEPQGGVYSMPSGLIRLKIGEGAKVIAVDDLTDSLKNSGVVAENEFSPNKSWIAPEYKNRPAIAGLPGGIVTVGSSSEGPDTYVMADDDAETILQPTELSSSYYRPNSQMATWYNGKVYAFGHSSSEPGKMYFRATNALKIDADVDEWSGQTDEEAAAEAMALIDALPSADEVDYNTIAMAIAAQDSYDALSATARDSIPEEYVAKLNDVVAAVAQEAIDTALAVVQLAKDLCEAAGIEYDPYFSPADNIAAAQEAIREANEAIEKATAQNICNAAGVDYDESKTPAENIAVANAAIEKAIADAEQAAKDVAAAKDAQSKAEAELKAAKSSIAKNVKTVTVNAKTVTPTTVKKAIAKVGGDFKYVTTIVLGSKVKTIKKSAFAKCKKVTTLQVQTKKLKKASVKKSLKGSNVKRVVVNVATAKAHKKFVNKYKKIFTKKNAGKKVKVQ